eukprot:3275175-Rhodomonas_salina.1
MLGALNFGAASTPAFGAPSKLGAAAAAPAPAPATGAGGGGEGLQSTGLPAKAKAVLPADGYAKFVGIVKGFKNKQLPLEQVRNLINCDCSLGCSAAARCLSCMGTSEGAPAHSFETEQRAQRKRREETRKERRVQQLAQGAIKALLANHADLVKIFVDWSSLPHVALRIRT